MPLKVSVEQKSELMATMAVLILNDDRVPITADNINTLIHAAGAEIEPFYPRMFQDLLSGRDVNALLLNSPALLNQAESQPDNQPDTQQEKQEQQQQKKRHRDFDDCDCCCYEASFSLFD